MESNVRAADGDSIARADQAVTSALEDVGSMPLLPAEPFLFPDDLFGESDPTPDESTRWWVLHTKPRAEKALARSLLDRGVPFFLPIHFKRWRSSGRSRTAYVPLFPGYVFFLGDHEASVEVLRTKLVARCLHVEDQGQLHLDLLQIHRLMANGAPLTPEARMLPGTPVEIIDGPLAGLEGKILRRRHKLRFLVEVNFIQRGASVEIEESLIRPLGKPS